MSSLPKEKMEMLVKLCGMFGSHYDGEIVNAARAAHKLVVSEKITWSVLLCPEEKLPPYQSKQQKSYPSQLWRTHIITILDNYEHSLSEWELKFLNSVLEFISPTLKQKNVLKRIFLKYGMNEVW